MYVGCISPGSRLPPRVPLSSFSRMPTFFCSSSSLRQRWYYFPPPSSFSRYSTLLLPRGCLSFLVWKDTNASLETEGGGVGTEKQEKNGGGGGNNRKPSAVQTYSDTHDAGLLEVGVGAVVGLYDALPAAEDRDHEHPQGEHVRGDAANALVLGLRGWK